MTFSHRLDIGAPPRVMPKMLVCPDLLRDMFMLPNDVEIINCHYDMQRDRFEFQLSGPGVPSHSVVTPMYRMEDGVTSFDGWAECPHESRRLEEATQ